MTEFLTWTAYGPLAAWGNVTVGERRTVDVQPSKSAVIGWLCGALGYKRGEREALSAMASGYDVALLLEQGGTLLSDYHTTQRPAANAYSKKEVPTTRRDALQRKGVNTTLSRREYSMDALCFIAVSCRPGAPSPLPALRDALAQPVFEPYLGRKACPVSWPLCPHVRTAPNPAEALAEQAQDEDHDLLNEMVREPTYRSGAWSARDPQRLFWEGDWPGLVPDGTTTRRDIPRDRVGWYFSERQEHFSQRQEHFGAVPAALGEAVE